MQSSLNNYHLVIFLVSVALSVIPQSVSGQAIDTIEPPHQQTKSDQQDQRKKARSIHSLSIDKLIEMLGSPDFSDRRDATQALNKHGADVLHSLRKAYHQADDMEVRLRIEGIVHKIYYRESLRTNVGWLGIMAGGINDRRIQPFRTPLPANQVGIPLADVTRDGPADIAGLAVGDIIIEINHEPFTTGNIRLAFELLKNTVQRLGPGGEISFTALRNGKRFTVHVILGHATRQILRAPEYQVKYAEAVGVANELFPLWWRQFSGSLDQPMTYEIERLTEDLDFEKKP